MSPKTTREKKKTLRNTFWSDIFCVMFHSCVVSEIHNMMSVLENLLFNIGHYYPKEILIRLYGLYRLFHTWVLYPAAVQSQLCFSDRQQQNTTIGKHTRHRSTVSHCVILWPLATFHLIARALHSELGRHADAWIGVSCCSCCSGLLTLFATDECSGFDNYVSRLNSSTTSLALSLECLGVGLLHVSPMCRPSHLHTHLLNRHTTKWFVMNNYVMS